MNSCADRLAEAVEGAAFDEAAVGDEGQHAVVVQAVRRPAEEPRIHVVDLGLLRGRRLDVGRLDPLVDLRVFAVLVVVVLVLLVGVVGRVADDDADLALVLALDALDVLVRHAAEQVVLVAGLDAEPSDIVERVDEAEVRELGELAGDRGIGRLDVQVGDVVGQDRHLVGVQLFLYLCASFCRLAAEMLEQFADEGAGAGGRVEDFDVAGRSGLAEVLLAQPVGALDHEAHDLVRRVDDAEPVGGLRVVDLVEVLVDDLEEGLLLGWLVISAALARIAA